MGLMLGLFVVPAEGSEFRSVVCFELGLHVGVVTLVILSCLCFFSRNKAFTEFTLEGGGARGDGVVD